MSKQITQTSEDIFDVYKQNVEKYFENDANTTQNIQTLTNIQSEVLKACKNTINSAISFQQDFAKKTGMGYAITETAKNAIIDSNKQIIKTKSVQNQILQTTANTIQQNIKTWNDSVGAFTDLNKNILQSWMSTFTQKQN